jgi:hypothetical protein
MRNRLITFAVLLVAICLLLWLTLPVWRLAFGVEQTGSGGIGAASAGISELMLLLVTILGLALVGLWTLVRAIVRGVLGKR